MGSWSRVFAAVLLATGALGCPEAGPAERAGSAVDEAVDGARDRLEEAEDGREEILDAR